MEHKYGFTKFTLNEFLPWVRDLKINRTILRIMEHHTWVPSYAHFTGINHFALQLGMQTYHKYNNGWADIGQHFTIFPDGVIMSGRNIESVPACIANKNKDAICIEVLGDFDKGKDQMTDAQKETVIKATAAFCEKFNLPLDTNSIIYHHWFAGYKTCPGSDFFGGNKKENFEENFLPLIRDIIDSPKEFEESNILKYVSVTASVLNIRTGPSTDFSKAEDNPNIDFGSVLRVYAEENGWLKISGSKERWVSGKYTKEVIRAQVKVNSSLNVRYGPSSQYKVIEKLSNEAIVFIYDEKNNWAKISPFDKWAYMNYLNVIS